MGDMQEGSQLMDSERAQALSSARSVREADLHCQGVRSSDLPPEDAKILTHTWTTVPLLTASWYSASVYALPPATNSYSTQGIVRAC